MNKIKKGIKSSLKGFSLKTLILIIGIIIGGGISIVLAAANLPSDDWQGTSWIEDGGAVSPEKIGKNFEYLYQRSDNSIDGSLFVMRPWQRFSGRGCGQCPYGIFKAAIGSHTSESKYCKTIGGYGRGDNQNYQWRTEFRTSHLHKCWEDYTNLTWSFFSR